MAGVGAVQTPVQLYPDETPEEGVELYGKPKLEHPEGVIKQRAAKYSFALKGEKSLSELENTIANGNEDSLRQEVAARQTQAKQKERLNLFGDIMKSYDGPPTVEDAEILKGMAQPSIVEPLDVFEKTYAETLMHTVMAQDDDEDGVFESSLRYDPERTMDAVDQGTDMIRWKEFTQRYLEDLRARAGKRTTGEKAWDMLETLAPGWSWSSQSRLLPEAKNARSFLQGDNVREQRNHLARLPPDEAARQLIQAIEPLAESNINEAIDFVQSMAEYSGNDQLFGNLNSLLDSVDMATIVPLTAGVKGARTAGKLAARTSDDVIAEAAEATGETPFRQTFTSPDGKTTTTVATNSKAATEAAAGKISARFSNSVKAETPKSKDPAIYEVNAPIRVREDGSPAGARYDRDTNSVHIHNATVDKGFAEKAWTKPRVEGVQALPEDTFETVEEWRQFVVDHEVAHARNPRKEGESKADYENRMNTVALTEAARRLRDRLPATPIDRHVETVKAVVRETSRPETKVEDVVAASGKLGEAAETKATKAAAPFRLSGRADPVGVGRRVINDLVSIFDPVSFTRGASRFSSAQALEIGEQLKRTGESIRQLMESGTRVIRTTEEAEMLAVQIARQQLQNRLGSSLNDAILDISGPEVLDVVADQAGVTTVHMQLGTLQKELFDDDMRAAIFASQYYGLPSGSYRIRNLGGKFYIDVWKAIDETNPDVRDAMVTTTNATPTSLSDFLPVFNLYQGFIKGADSLVSKFNRQNRITAVHGISRLHKLTKEAGEQIGKLSAREKRELSRLMTANKNAMYPDPDREGHMLRGIEQTTLPEFEKAYYDANGKWPSVKAAKAYFSSIQISDVDYFFRNLDLYKSKTRQGVEEFKFKITKADGTEKDSHWVEGKEIDRLPDMPDDAGILIYNREANTTEYKRKTVIDSEIGVRDAIHKLITEEGYKIIQIANPGRIPLSKDFGTNDTVNFLIVKDSQARPLDWRQIPRRPGGHVMYSDKHFVKQAKMRNTQYGKVSYEGDTTIFGFATEAQARKFAPRVEKARQLLGTPELGPYLKKNLPFTKKEFEDFFNDKIDPETGEILEEARLSKNEPIVYLPDKTGSNDWYKNDLKARYGDKYEDTIDSPYNLYRDLDKEFAGERNPSMFSVEERGTDANPLFKLTPANELDPLDVISKATSGMLRSRFMNDYKIMAVESWTNEFGKWMDAKGGLAEIRGNPARWLHDRRWIATMPPDVKARAESSRVAILNLLGTVDEVGRTTEQVFGKLQNMIYKGLGKDSSDWVASHIIPSVRDPFKFVRAVAFHPKMGFFNPIQFVLNYQTMTHITGVAGPKNAYKGHTAGWLMNLARMNNKPEILDHMAKTASKLGFGTKEEFLESYNAWKQTGKEYVEGETAYLDDLMGPSLVGSRIPGWAGVKRLGGNALDAGLVFFKEGERIMRTVAWNTAYREWRDANPGAVLDDRAINSISDRSDLLTVNMTRASNASWSQGPLSLTTQFMGYQVRLMEQFLGKRLTTQEKVQSLLVYSLMYGIPTAGAVTAGVWPFQASVKQSLYERGINADEGVVGAMTNGLFPTLLNGMISLATGEDSRMNWSERYGPQGLSIFRELTRGNADMSDLLLGAGGGILGDIVENTEPLLSGLIGFFQPEGRPIVFEDYLDAVRDISTANNLIKGYYAMNWGIYMTKNQVLISRDLKSTDAMLGALFGVTPQDISRDFLLADSNKARTQAQKSAEAEIIKYIRLAYDASTSKLDFEKYQKIVHIHLVGAGFTPADYPALMGKAMNGYDPMSAKVRSEFFFNNVPPEQKEAREKLGRELIAK